MEKKLSLVFVIVILFYGLYNAKRKDMQTSAVVSKQKVEKSRISSSDELHKLYTQAYKKQYIIDVINNGSSQLKFKQTEVMDAGFASKEDAPKIASYILALSSKNSSLYPKDAPMYYSSNCAGCHGDDAKGLNGTYPDLTKDKLLGILKREDELKSHF